MTLKVTIEADGSAYYECAACAMRITNLAPHVTLHTLNGVVIPELFAPISADISRTFRFHNRCRVIVDMYDVEAMRYQLREQMEAFLRSHRGSDLKLYVLVRARLVEMSVSLGNLMTGTSFMDVYRDIAKWEESCKRELPGFRRRPIRRTAAE